MPSPVRFLGPAKVLLGFPYKELLTTARSIEVWRFLRPCHGRNSKSGASGDERSVGEEANMSNHLNSTLSSSEYNCICCNKMKAGDGLLVLFSCNKY